MKKASLFMVLFLALSAFPLFAEEASGGATAEATAAPKKARALPFRSVIDYVDEEHRAYFRMGKYRLRKVYITPDTRFFLASGEAATVEDLRVGADVRGSYRQRPDGHYDGVTIKIGTKEH